WCASPKTFQKRFGSWKQALMHAGLTKAPKKNYTTLKKFMRKKKRPSPGHRQGSSQDTQA
ncbi:hypothetical protein COY95_03115, partial [Candidatus Woesearchaeota archaeon CG_4_10_14_0_8_um_filter_47_5]